MIKADDATRARILDLLPQKPPFRFIDAIEELSTAHIVTRYTFKPDEFFYQGHFPGDPVTPGVILAEAMAQAGLVALGLYLLETARPGVSMRTLFSECQVEFLQVVRPLDTVVVRGELLFWRKNKVKSNVELRLANGELAASGVVSGIGMIVG